MEEDLNSDLERTIFILQQFVVEDDDGSSLIEFDKKTFKNFLNSFSGQEKRNIYSIMYNVGLIHPIGDKVYVDYNRFSTIKAYFDPDEKLFSENEY